MINKPGYHILIFLHVIISEPWQLIQTTTSGLEQIMDCTNLIIRTGFFMMKQRLTHFLALLLIFAILGTGCAIIKAPLTDAHTLEGDEAQAVCEYADPMTGELLTGLINRDYALFSSNFSETLKSGMDAAAMETMARLLNETLGGYQSHSADTILSNDDHITVVYKITAASNAVATLRVVFSTEQGHPITGLWLDSPELRK